MKAYPKNYCLLAGCNCPEHIEAAKQFIKDRGFTSDEVRLIANENEILVLTIKEVEIV